MCMCVRRSVVVAHVNQVLVVHLRRSVPRHRHQGTGHLQHRLHATLPHLSHHLQGTQLLQLIPVCASVK